MKALLIDFAYDEGPLVPTEKTEGIIFILAIFYPNSKIAFTFREGEYVARHTSIMGMTRVIQEIDVHKKYYYLAIHTVFSAERQAKSKRRKGG